MRGKKLTIIFMMMIILCIASSDILPVQAAGLPTDYTNEEASNLIGYYGTCRSSFIGETADGGYQTVVYVDGILYVENFDQAYQSVMTKQVELELPLWGGVLLGKEYNYVVCGQKYDSSQTNGGEVYRVIKYDKEFNRLAAISLTASETYTRTPFQYGNVSMAESNGLLIVYTSRGRSDGNQSNIAIRINISDMTIYNTSGMQFKADVHAEDSMRQIVKFDGTEPVYADETDDVPTCIFHVRYGENAKTAVELDGFEGNYYATPELSGLEISDTHYLVVGSYLYQRTNNVFLRCVNKETKEVTGQWLTDASVFETKAVWLPRITKIAEDRYVIMWNAQTVGGYAVEYVIADGSGNIISGVKSAEGTVVTDCEPIFAAGKLQWIRVKDGEISFERITDFKESGTLELSDRVVEARDPWDGTSDTSWYREEKTTFEISTPEQLAGLAELVNGGNTFAEKKVLLTNDIFLNDETYSNEWTPMVGWEGTFLGNAYGIYNMYTTDEASGGLFSSIGENGKVIAVNISQGLLEAGGCIADENYGIIAMCNNYSYVCGAYSGWEMTGGICNTNYNWVYGCKNYGTVCGSYVGGIVGKNSNAPALVSQCSNYGAVEGESGGIVYDSRGWIYNCYNVGLVTNISQNYLYGGKGACGIVYEDKGHTSNCYSAGLFTINESMWFAPQPIGSVEGITSCYTLPMDGTVGDTIVVSQEEMMSEAFLERLDYQDNTVFSAWRADTAGVNDGLPITVADECYNNGIYKFQPELWTINNNVEIVLEDGAYKFSCDCYYNEEAPIITVADPKIAKVSYDGEDITVTPLKKGTTYINIHFNETENVISEDYNIELKVTSTVPEIAIVYNESRGAYTYTIDGAIDTNMTGLAYYEAGNQYLYFENGVQNTEFYGLTEFGGGKFFVANGAIATECSGLQLIGDNFYFLAYGQLQEQYTGLALYDGQWFYVVDGVLQIGYYGLLDYDGSKFLIATGQILGDYTGLYNDAVTGNWYYIVFGQVQTQYTGLVAYDGAWFYLVDGMLASDYNGTVIFDGAEFIVANGQVVG